MKYLDKSFSVGGATEAYEDGFERTFGKRQENKGKRWVYRKNEATGEVECIEVGADFTGAERRAQTGTEELTYGKAGVATDGTPIDSRRKHAEYMKRNNLTLADDFKGTWAKAEAERGAFFGGKDSTRRDAVGRAVYAPRKRK
jgi:hypothetical protein